MSTKPPEQTRIEPIVRLEMIALDPITRKVTLRYTFNNGVTGILVFDERNPITINLNVPILEPSDLSDAKNIINEVQKKQ